MGEQLVGRFGAEPVSFPVGLGIQIAGRSKGKKGGVRVASSPVCSLGVDLGEQLIALLLGEDRNEDEVLGHGR